VSTQLQMSCHVSVCRRCTRRLGSYKVVLAAIWANSFSNRIRYRDEIATTPALPTEEAVARIERRGTCTSEPLALVVHSPRVARSVLGARAAAAAGAATRIAIWRIVGSTERRDRTTTVVLQTSAHNGTYACARGPQAPSASGSTRHAANRRSRAGVLAAGHLRTN
jgi:hypothetical protein